MAYLVSVRALPRLIERYGYAFSWRRAWNVLKVLASMGVSWVVGRPVVWGRPFMMMVEPTNFCNLKCPLCPSGNGQMERDRGNMDLDSYRRLIDEVRDHVLLLMLWNQGEPFINKGFLEMVRYARDQSIPVMTSTNGHFVRTIEQALEVVDSGLSEIIISLDGVDQETYERYRVGGSLEKVLDGARLLAQAKVMRASSTPLVNMQFIVFRHNEGDLARAEELAHELSADKFLIKTAQVYDTSEASTFLPEEELFRRYEADPDEAKGDDELRVKGQPSKGCKVLWYSSMVNWNGDVAPCCFDKDVDYGMGDAFNGQSFAQIWQDAPYKAFRQRILDDRMSVDMCRNCSEGYRGMFSLVKELTGS
ncbi:MAG: radical SAM protein [Gemmatimonadetes bacterium]|jgi:radical SAM protein with 4Fe4S-binding SPASM domain|nr:radical SAM protein [Gemmatimonadota bacterium]MBT7860102.1 radical SAM protein [Gemmatimonadota bacterium]